MLASFFLDTCRNAGIDFFTGVPDSFLNGLCSELVYQYGPDDPSHIVAHNEGGAVALCAGHYLASGRPALCYMQNSGLGNAVNPLASLMDLRVYAMPCLLVVGWRGEPGVKDEPQHVRQGAVTPGQLDLLGIPYRILSADTAEEQFLADFRELDALMKEGLVTAFIVKKSALTSDHPYTLPSLSCLSREKAAELVLSAAKAGDIFVSTTGKLSREVFEIRERRRETHEMDFLTVGSMGHASMIALRISLEKPDRTVFCLDGDGAALMHLGSLPLIGALRPRRFIHLVINNGAHESVGGMPVCRGRLNICALGEAAGYVAVFTAETEPEVVSCLEKARAVSASGPVLLEIRCACNARKDLGRPTLSPHQNRDAFMEYLK